MTAEATDPPVGTGASGDLVIIALSGVQRFISESRTTADLWGASEIVRTLAEEAATACGPADGVTVVFPALAPGGTSDLAIPNHPAPEWTRRRLCSQSPRWLAEQRRPRLPGETDLLVHRIDLPGRPGMERETA